MYSMSTGPEKSIFRSPVDGLYSNPILSMSTTYYSVWKEMCNNISLLKLMKKINVNSSKKATTVGRRKAFTFTE